MIDTIAKKNFFKKIQILVQNNYFNLIIFIIFLIIVAFAYQFYTFNKKNSILQASIDYNLSKSLESPKKFNVLIENLSKEKNFFGILAKLDKIKLQISEDSFELAYTGYIDLLNSKKLKNLYKTAISIQASYLLMNKVNEVSDISIKILNLISFADQTIESYSQFRLEVLYLLSVYEDENNDSINISDETIKLYNQIQENSSFSTSLKERVKKINEFQIYK